MRNNAFFQPIVLALAFALRWPSIVAWLVLVGVAMGMRAAQAQLFEAAGAPNLALLSLVTGMVPALVGAVLAFFLARALLAPQTGHANPLYWRFIGLFLLISTINWFVSIAGAFAIFSSERSQFMMTYGSVLVGPIGSILLFPVFVRMIATAAGAMEPRLGRTWAVAFDEGRAAYLWYAVCAVAFPVLMVFTFANLLPHSNEANALPGNLAQSAITGTGGLLRYLLAIVVAQWAIPGWARQVEAFA